MGSCFNLRLWVIARWLNRRTLTSERPYDFAVNMMFGTIAGDAVLFHRVPLWGGTLALAVLGAALWSVEAVLTRHPGLAAGVVGRPVPLARGGRFLTENLRRLHLTEEDLLAKLREMQISGVADVELAQLELDGRIGVIPKRPG